jgi:hypothetical protein
MEKFGSTVGELPDTCLCLFLFVFVCKALSVGVGSIIGFGVKI